MTKEIIHQCSQLFTIFNHLVNQKKSLISKNIFQFSESRVLSKNKLRMLGMYVYKLIRNVFC